MFQYQNGMSLVLRDGRGYVKIFRIVEVVVVDKLEEKLRDKIYQYWKDRNFKEIEPHLIRYVDDILPKEMEWAENNPFQDEAGQNICRLPNRKQKPCKLLVLLVGFSIEPLLQTVYAYQPEQVLLLLNRQYGDRDEGGRNGKSQGKLVKQFIEKIDLNAQVSYEIVEADTVSVFCKLREKVIETKGVIIDITGGKKSMIAGAFLYAAYANIEITYVDFDDEAYDLDMGLPYGNCCRIGTLENPYTTFALRDWEQVKTLYEDYRFGAARALLVGEDGQDGAGTIKEAVKQYMSKAIEGVDALAEVLHVYELWDGGALNEAKIYASKIAQKYNLTFKWPDAIEGLGGRWPKLKGPRFDNFPKELYDDDGDMFRVYVTDELERIKRLCEYGEDFRSTFLRAGSLNEVIMVARLVKLVTNPTHKDKLLEALQEKTPTARALFGPLLRLEWDKGKWIEKTSKEILIGSDRKKCDIVLHNMSRILRNSSANELKISISKKMTFWWQNNLGVTIFNGKYGWDEFIEMRNKLTHTYVSVPKDYAIEAINFVQANFEDFLGDKVESLPFIVKTVGWSELCGPEQCNLAPYLPPNLK
jgi:hypothetical protein